MKKREKEIGLKINKKICNKSSKTNGEKKKEIREKEEIMIKKIINQENREILKINILNRWIESEDTIKKVWYTSDIRDLLESYRNDYLEED